MYNIEHHSEKYKNILFNAKDLQVKQTNQSSQSD